MPKEVCQMTVQVITQDEGEFRESGHDSGKGSDNQRVVGEGGRMARCGGGGGTVPRPLSEKISLVQTEVLRCRSLQRWTLSCGSGEEVAVTTSVTTAAAMSLRWWQQEKAFDVAKRAGGGKMRTWWQRWW